MRAARAENVLIRKLTAEAGTPSKLYKIVFQIKLFLFTWSALFSLYTYTSLPKNADLPAHNASQCRAAIFG